MSRIIILLLSVLVVFIACEKDTVSEEQESTIDTDTIPSLDFTSLCIPPFQIDTSKVRMYALQDGLPYRPMRNFSCIVRNFFLQIDQIWINGAISPGLSTLTLIVPKDIQPGTYAFQANSPYDARYVPSGMINFTVTAGELLITQHDTINNIIAGGFDFIATNLDSPVLPRIAFEEGCFWACYEE